MPPRPSSRSTGYGPSIDGGAVMEGGGYYGVGLRRFPGGDTPESTCQAPRSYARIPAGSPLNYNASFNGLLGRFREWRRPGVCLRQAQARKDPGLHLANLPDLHRCRPPPQDCGLFRRQRLAALRRELVRIRTEEARLGAEVAARRRLRRVRELLRQRIRDAVLRSEEHTSELQSHSFISYALFCLK